MILRLVDFFYAVRIVKPKTFVIRKLTHLKRDYVIRYSLVS